MTDQKAAVKRTNTIGKTIVAIKSSLLLVRFPPTDKSPLRDCILQQPTFIFLNLNISGKGRKPPLCRENHDVRRHVAATVLLLRF